MNPVAPTSLAIASDPTSPARLVGAMGEHGPRATSEASASTAARVVGTPGSTEAEKSRERIQGAARDFEAVFLRQMLSCLERTTKVSSKGRGDAGQSTYGSMIVDVVAEAVAKAGGLGLGDVLAKAMGEKAQEAGLSHPVSPASTQTPMPDKIPPDSRSQLKVGAPSEDVRISPQGLSPTAVPRTEIRASAVPIKGPLADRRIR